MGVTQNTTATDRDITQLSSSEFDAYLGWLSRDVYRREPVEVTFPDDFEAPF
ncbi:hypothetical protein [Pseudonocardia sp. WMMC193]|uniref:hypothetical protein n=1 Tax=Pseudonocardia sp. WMMC193 TaxID=2911965 RepID=UPI001F4152E3|nr:hypothetical protein [Pseudonocardia sp. WMMC193]MCF7547317.1 hypothetical protein [Pseudonocardia sp. WMMC193]